MDNAIDSYTLPDYLNSVEVLFNSIPTADIDFIKKQRCVVYKSISVMQGCVKRLVDLYNEMTVIIKSKTVESTVTDEKPHDISSDAVDSAHKVHDVYNVNNTRIDYLGYALYVRSIANVNYMAAMPIYYLPQSDTFSLLLAGDVISGGLCDIRKDKKQFAKCVKCHVACDKWHPLGSHRLTDNLDDQDSQDNKQIRNLPISSWLYNPSGMPCVRRVGSVSNLHRDLGRLTKKTHAEELELRRAQLIHDVVIYMIIKQHSP